MLKMRVHQNWVFILQIKNQNVPNKIIVSLKSIINKIFLDKTNNLGFGSDSKNDFDKESDDSDFLEKIYSKRNKRRIAVVDDEEGYHTSNNLQYEDPSKYILSNNAK